MTRRIVFSTIVAILFAASLSIADDNRENQTIELSTDRRTSEIGEVIRLVGVVPKNSQVKVRRVSLEIVQVAKYDMQGRLVACPQDAENKSYDLSWAKAESDGIEHRDLDIDFNTATPRSKGIEQELRTTRVGIFLVTMTWTLPDETEWKSQPIVVEIVPPQDGVNPKKIKAEWLEAQPLNGGSQPSKGKTSTRGKSK